MAKYIKNTTGSTKTWVGQEVGAGSYHQIAATEYALWASNALVIADVGAGNALLATANDGTGDITDAGKGLDFLRDELTPRQVTSAGVVEPNNYRARMRGLGSWTIPNGTTYDCDYQMQQLAWLGTNKKSYFDGVQYYAKDAVVGDSVKFQVVDKDGLVYPAGTVLEEFGDSWYVMPDQSIDIRLFKSAIVPGMYIRIKYTSTGGTDVKFVGNLFRFIKTDENA